MTLPEINELLEVKSIELTQWLYLQVLDQWTYAPPEKWTTGQHVLHLIQSIKPLRKALSLPKWVLKYKFGFSNRDTRPYEMVIDRYQTKLAAAGKIRSPYSEYLSVPSANEKDTVIENFSIEVQKLIHSSSKWKESHLDKYILPHPLMGKMPIRELLMWSVYHTEHHLGILKNKY